MSMCSRDDRLALFNELKNVLAQWSKQDIEDGIVAFYLKSISLEYVHSEAADEIVRILISHNMPADLESIVEFFETLVEQTNKNENGIVYTPRYICDYIVSNILSNISEWNEDISILDPGCGGGIFLVSAAEYLHEKFDKDIDSIITNNIFGIELDEDNARRCCLVLRLLSAKYGGDYSNVVPNVKCRDSLRCPWPRLFGRDKNFDFVIGNPPYVNLHDMDKKSVAYLKKNFVTTQKGVFNIFYAFIEQAVKFLDINGRLGFIVPNNFLTIKSAIGLRDFIQKNNCLEMILDFGENMAFRPVRTYNCIIFLTKQPNPDFKFYIMPRTEKIELELKRSSQFLKMSTEKLDRNGWKLVDQKTYENLTKIEGQKIPIKKFIRTGMATLRDNIYFVEHDKNGYYKLIDGTRYNIEEGLVKPIYKVPELKLHEKITDSERYIIFPYIKSEKGYSLIDEEMLKAKFPRTYEVLLLNKPELDARDKGKLNPHGWYAYGRTQGLNKYGKKLLFPTFSKYPKFTYIDNENALFCNGYAIFENEYFELDILIKILNSIVMYYYVINTSYPIEGGYYCYQKKYIENFSIPELSEEQISLIRAYDSDDLNNYLLQIYELKM